MSNPHDNSKTQLAKVLYLDLDSNDKRIEHVDSTTIVEAAVTDEDRAEFMRVYKENCNE